MSSRISDSSAAHTPPQFTPFTRRKTGFSPRHSRQSTDPMDIPGRQRASPAVFQTRTALFAINFFFFFFFFFFVGVPLLAPSLRDAPFT